MSVKTIRDVWVSERSLRDYVKVAAPEPEVLRVIGGIAERNRTDKLISRQIDQIIKAVRAEKKRR